MNTKSAKKGEYMVEIDQTGHVSVLRIYGNVKESLREIYKTEGWEFDPKWTTRQMGNDILKRIGTENSIKVGEYAVTKRDDGSIETYRDFGKGNVKEALRNVAKENGMEIDPSWNTQTLGRKLIDFLNGEKQ